MKLILNEELPATLRKALDREAEAENLTVSDAASKVLCERFEVTFSPSRTSFRPVAKRFKLRVSEDLHRLIRMEAAIKSQTVRGIVLSILAEHYGVKPIDPQRRRRKETV